jgi:hypothetical protein
VIDKNRTVQLYLYGYREISGFVNTEIGVGFDEN